MDLHFSFALKPSDPLQQIKKKKREMDSLNKFKWISLICVSKPSSEKFDTWVWKITGVLVLLSFMDLILYLSHALKKNNMLFLCASGNYLFKNADRFLAYTLWYKR